MASSIDPSMDLLLAPETSMARQQTEASTFVQSTDLSARSRQCSDEYRQGLKTGTVLSACPDLFRGVHPSRVLDCFAQVFATGQFEGKAIVTAKSTHTLSPTLSVKRRRRGPETLVDPVHGEADELFYSTLQVSHVGAFISHVWIASRWRKALALCYYMNIKTAVIASVLSWVALMIIMVSSHGPTGLGGREDLLSVFVGVPLVVFLCGFTLGHKISVPVETVWVDKLCIHQTREPEKEVGVSALPEFVANSERMIVLWSSSYFERLWCNAEVATFAALNNGASNIDMLPLWFAPWVLTTMLFDVLAIAISSELFGAIEGFGAYFAGTRAMQTPGLVTFLSLFFGVGYAFTISYMPLALVTWHSLRTKMRDHEDMIEQCANFQVANAQCAVESDREIVLDLVTNLFQDSENPIQEFNSFVNKDLANHIAARIGNACYIPYRQCLLLLLPLALSAAINVWGCDNMPCEVAAEAEIGAGAPPYQQMLTNAAAWSVCIFGVYPTVYPVMLIGMTTVKSWIGCWGLRALSEVLVVVCSYTYMALHAGFAAGIVNAFSQQLNVNLGASAVWFVLLGSYLVLLFCFVERLFRFEHI
jgi:hypothetical protein